MEVALIGKSKAVKKITKQIKKLSARPGDILITGERGSGKSVVARNIHTMGMKGNAPVPFYEINLPKLSDEELSEIFCKKTSIEGDSSNNLIEKANGGTILIEDIESTGFRNQTKILKFLEKLQELRTENQANVRMIVTTKNDIEILLQSNEILPELANYINSYSTIEVPPLRERKEDIPHLVEHFIVNACKKIGIDEPVLDINAISILVDQPWKNNIHELKTVIERSVIFSTNGTFVLPQELLDEKASVTRMLEVILTGEGQEINGSLDTIERNVIASTLKRFDFNFEQAAQFLGMNLQTLEHRAYQLGLNKGNQ